MPRAKTSDEPRDFEKLIIFQGGCNTAVEPGVIPFGKFSRIQNLRPRHNGFEQRGGCNALHTVADATNQVMSLFQFTKALVDETHLFAQMNDGDLLEATNIPPTVTTGAFGTESFNGTAGQIPASWGVVDDILLHSNGVDQHQIYPGSSVKVDQFVVYTGSEALPLIPEVGNDYTTEVRDVSDLTYGVLDSLSNTNHCFLFRCRFVPSSFTLELSSLNSNASALTLKYWNGAWTSVAITDGTSTGGATLGQNGTISFTIPSDITPNYLYGVMGFWFMFTVSAALDAEVRITKANYSGTWQSLHNIWDSIPVQAAEVQLYKAATGVYETYSGDSVDVSSVTSSDIFYILSADPIEGLYIEVGDSPSTTGSVTINSVSYYTGTAWASVGTVTDYTSGLTRTGWVKFPKVTGALPTQFGKNKSYGFWYKVQTSGTISADTYISVATMPFFDINEIGRSGFCNIAWKGRGVYTFGDDQIYVSANGEPQVLNGDNFAILEPGDGKKNKVIALASWYNELMAVQEEKAGKGGITLFEGYSPKTFGKIGVSDTLGVFNAKCLVVVDGVKISTHTEEKVKKLAFGLCSKGLWRYDGTTPQMVSNEVRNYFDSTKDECIRRGYENQHWLAYDPRDNVLLIGIVSGTVATVPNIFMVYDLTDTKDPWSFDERAQAFSHMINIESSSGNIRNIQIAGGAGDGLVYPINTTSKNDVSTAIDAYVLMELDGEGEIIELRKMVLRRKSGEGGCRVTPTVDGVELESFDV